MAGKESGKKCYIIKERAVPEVLRKVVEAKRLLELGKAETVQEAIEQTGISRSSFYKYKEDIFPVREEAEGKTLTCILQIEDCPGLLSGVLQTIALHHGNILTIHQSIPVNGVATLTLTVRMLPDRGDEAAMAAAMKKMEGVHYLKILE